MIGLIIKDFINLKRNIKVLGFIILIYGISSYIMKDASYFGSIFTLVFGLLMLTTYGYDDYAKWDNYALTLPINRNDIILAKYMVLLLLTFVGAVINILFTGLMSAIQNTHMDTNMLRDTWIAAGLGFALVILFYSIVLPFITKFGIEKARIICILIYGIFFGIYMFFRNIIQEGNSPVAAKLIQVLEIVRENVYIILPVLVIIAVVISYMVSANIYRKKEF